MEKVATFKYYKEHCQRYGCKVYLSDIQEDEEDYSAIYFADTIREIENQANPINSILVALGYKTVHETYYH